MAVFGKGNKVGEESKRNITTKVKASSRMNFLNMIALIVIQQDSGCDSFKTIFVTQLYIRGKKLCVRNASGYD